jgi:hypothetical protein
METEMFDNSDGSLDLAVEKIMGKLGGGEPAPEPRQKAPSRADEVQTETDPVIEPEAEAEAEEVEAEAEPAEKEADDFLEIPSEKEGEAPIKVRTSEALEAYKQMRQMNESIASAINKHEADYIAQQDKVLGELRATYDTVRQNAEAALRTMPQPQRPSRLLMDPNSGYYDPAAYAHQMGVFEDQVAALQHYQSEARKAAEGQDRLAQIEAQRHGEREYTRLSRHPGFQDWADAGKREALESALLDKLGKHFGIGLEDVQGVRSHKLWLLADAAIKAAETRAEAPNIRKQVKETAAKVTASRSTPPRGGDGKFVSDARKELAETGSVDAFANLLIRSGALR